jgi:hypothetical protein
MPAVAATQTGAGWGHLPLAGDRLYRSVSRLAAATTTVTNANKATAAIGVSTNVTPALSRRGSL